MVEGRTVRLIRNAVGAGRIPSQFRAADVNDALGIRFAGTFLPKYCNGNPGKARLCPLITRRTVA